MQRERNLEATCNGGVGDRAVVGLSGRSQRPDRYVPRVGGCPTGRGTSTISSGRLRMARRSTRRTGRASRKRMGRNSREGVRAARASRRHGKRVQVRRARGRSRKGRRKVGGSGVVDGVVAGLGAGATTAYSLAASHGPEIDAAARAAGWDDAAEDSLLDIFARARRPHHQQSGGSRAGEAALSVYDIASRKTPGRMIHQAASDLERDLDAVGLGGAARATSGVLGVL